MTVSPPALGLTTILVTFESANVDVVAPCTTVIVVPLSLSVRVSAPLVPVTSSVVPEKVALSNVRQYAFSARRCG